MTPTQQPTPARAADGRQIVEAETAIDELAQSGSGPKLEAAMRVRGPDPHVDGNEGGEIGDPGNETAGTFVDVAGFVTEYEAD